MHSNVVRLVTLDLVLRFIGASMNGVPLELNRNRMYFDNRTADAAGFRVPTHVVTLTERSLLHRISRVELVALVWLRES